MHAKLFRVRRTSLMAVLLLRPPGRLLPRPLSPMNPRTRAAAPDTRRRRRVRPNCSNSPAIQLDFFLGTFAPFFRASERPIAIAWDLLFTRPPLPPFPDFSVPCFRRVIALLTDLPAAFPYLGIVPPVFPRPIATGSEITSGRHC